MNIDLHTHSTASDGSLSPSQLVAGAEKLGIAALALTDHDTVDGLAEFMAAGANSPVTVVGGVEISLEYPNEFHLLAYNIKGGGEIPSQLARLQGFRDDRNRVMLEKLRGQGYDITWERLKELAAGGQLGRPHFARALLEKGYFSQRQEIFDKLLAKGRPGYVDKIRLSQAGGLEMARAAGWAPVLAHPVSLKLSAAQWPDFMAALVDQGLAGVEIFHPSMTEDESRFFRALAARFSLVPTAGSDFHGEGKPAIPLDWVRRHSTLGLETLELLKNAL